MPLDRQTRALLATINSRPPLPFEPNALRAQEKKSLPPLSIERAHVARIDEREIPGPAGSIPIRSYTPLPEQRFGDVPPLLVYFHGGGHTIGSLDSHDGVCCRLCNESGFIVVSVDYRLAPEHRFPAALDDSFAALQWVADHGAELGGDSKRLVVAGDSAGGNLAAVCCVLARDRGGPAIAYQALIYPVTLGRFDTPSQLRNAEGLFLTRDLMQWFAQQYCSDLEQTVRDPRYAVADTASLVGLPPALIVTAEFDPLLDDGEIYAQRLRVANVPVEYICYEGTIHNFVVFYHFIDKGKQAIALIADRLRERFPIT